MQTLEQKVLEDLTYCRNAIDHVTSKNMEVLSTRDTNTLIKAQRRLEQALMALQPRPNSNDQYTDGRFHPTAA